MSKGTAGVRVVVTGGAGFVGASTALHLKARHPDWAVVAFDSLHRRGSELNLPRLRSGGVEFLHGDVRERDDLAAAGPFDALVECSAEPSVLAGVGGAPAFAVTTNLVGAFACLEQCRVHGASLVFLSTSRVYPVGPLRALRLEEREERFELADGQETAGVSARGISEAFPLDGTRTLYGATKLAAELLIAEYRELYGLRAVVDRFGVIAGPWQMGKVDQGIVAHWVVSHHFGRPLRAIGFGGTGRQVRDVLHVADAADLIERQVRDPDAWDGAVVNAGGGADRSVSLLELTALCREATGREVPVTSEPETRPGDVPFYVSDCARLEALTDWRPTRDVAATVSDVARWVAENERDLAAVLDA